MGDGINFVCSECGKEYSVSLGIGFNFPRDYRKCLLEVKKGKYGSEWKELYLNNQYVAVNADRHVYLCKKCGHWVVEEDLSLYIPNNLDVISIKIKEMGKDYYVMDDELKEDYHLLKRRIHKCSNCGKVMHKANFEEIVNLKCPKCGGKPRFIPCWFSWD